MKKPSVNMLLFAKFFGRSNGLPRFRRIKAGPCTRGERRQGHQRPRAGSAGKRIRRKSPYRTAGHRMEERRLFRYFNQPESAAKDDESDEKVA